MSVRFQGKPLNITVIQAYAPTSNTEEAEVERFFEDLQDLLELIPKKDVLFIIGDWNAKVGSQETPGVTGKFGLGVWNKQGKVRGKVIDKWVYLEKNILHRQSVSHLRSERPQNMGSLVFIGGIIS